MYPTSTPEEKRGRKGFSVLSTELIWVATRNMAPGALLASLIAPIRICSTLGMALLLSNVKDANPQPQLKLASEPERQGFPENI